MDNLGYTYYAGTNRLQQVTDVIAAGTFATDIDNQAVTTNYVYDGIGNLVKDSSESLNVVWSPYGKVLTANRLNATTNIQTQYGYDAMQNRILKTFINVADTTRSYYIRDAQGNTMAVYTRRRDTVVWTEQHLYGSSRLGIWESNLRLTPSVDVTKSGRIQEGQKRYELTNHLGNVLVTVNDRRKGTDTNGDSFFDVYDGVEITATDFYPFGLEMQGRTFQAASYRYGFNGKENDRSSWSSTQLVQDYGMRLYNPAIGRFLSVDPLADDYPWYTPYQFAGNMPIWAVDVDGLEPAIVNGPNTSEARDGTRPAEPQVPLLFGGQLIKEVEVKADRVQKGDPKQWKKEDIKITSGGDISFKVGGVNVVQRASIATGGSQYYAVYSDPKIASVKVWDEGEKNDQYWRNMVAAHELIAYTNATLIETAFSMGASSGAGVYARGSARFASANAALLKANKVSKVSKVTKLALTDAQLVQKAATFVDSYVPFTSTAQLTGTLKHQAANRYLSLYQRLYGNRGIETNFYFNNNTATIIDNRGFLDVVNHRTMSIWDFKFGVAGWRTGQLAKYTRNFPGYSIDIIRP